MAQTIDSMAPADTRDQTYRLLSECSPVRVVVDTELPAGAWYVVRAPHEWERKKLAAESPAALVRVAPQERWP
jgi:hypothetical protein